METEFYLAFDVDRIQQTIFESNWLPLVRSGSLDLAELGKPASALQALRDTGVECRPSPDVVFADGGSGLVRFKPVSALGLEEAQERVARKFEEWFARKSGFATTTAVVVPTETSWHGHAVTVTSPQRVVPRLDHAPARTFARAFRHASLLLEARKHEKEKASLLEVPAWAGLCWSCGIRPATDTYHERQLCPVCEHKRTIHDERKLGDYKPIEQFKDAFGAVALVYLDGNGIGQRREEACERGEDGLREFAAALGHAIDNACESVERQDWLALSLGGDDVAIIIRGDAAIRALHVFARAFKGAATGPIKGVTFSAGLAVAPHRTPIPFLYRYAYDLCESAKALARRCPDEWTCDLAILTGTSPLASDIDTIRAQQLTFRRGGETLRLSGGPWTLPELWEHSHAVTLLDRCGVSSSALRQLVDACRSLDRRESTLFARAQWAADPALRKWTSHAYPKWDDWPWREALRLPGIDYVTDLADLARWRERLKTGDLAEPVRGASC